MSTLLKRGGLAFRGILSRMNTLKSWVDFQRFMIFLLDQLVERTTEGFTTSGLAQDASAYDGGTVFLSSHRSTSLDPAMANYLLWKRYGRSAYNAAGDNIFGTPWLGHLIRLNKGFIVKRNVEDPDEKIREAERLSEYINELLAKDSWVWIAHRNGRAKDGRDKTDSAVLAMLKLSQPELNWAEFSQNRKLVPLAMSWEIIPLDDHMAMELNGITAHDGKQRDMMNVVSEIRMEKKRLHLHFGQPVQAEKRSTLVKGIDRQIHLNTRLWEANWLAYSKVAEDEESEPVFAAIKDRIDLSGGLWLEERIKNICNEIGEKLSSGELRANEEGISHDGLVSRIEKSLWEMYAGPVRSALESASLEEVLEAQDGLSQDLQGQSMMTDGLLS